jgi:ubiquinone/menaquinone biosynthesis C-methylase UbiE
MDIQNVYDNIAHDFDKTRYQMWPVVKKFIIDLPYNCFVGDIGCGNGKNMMLSGRKDIKFKGIDLSQEFVNICHSKGLDVINGNILDIPFLSNSVDHSISIAVIHHLQEKKDRINAIEELLRITKIGGLILLYVWAFKQPENSKRKFISYDEMVPYKTKSGDIYYRYYHLYQENELENDIKQIKKYDIEIIDSGYEYGNYYCVIKKIN